MTLTLPAHEQPLNKVRRRTALLHGELRNDPPSDGLAHISLRIPITT